MGFSLILKMLSRWSLSIFLTLGLPIAAFADCSGATDGALKLVENRFSKLSLAFTAENIRPMFFVGLWSRAEERDRRRLAGAKSAEVETGKLRSIMSSVSSRLSEDRRELATWVSNNRLTDEIEVQPIPLDGSFLLIRTTRKGLEAMLCESAKGELPAILTELGF